jgi:23S rRNA pseudouridine1911/1915/1917 synthase
LTRYSFQVTDLDSPIRIDQYLAQLKEMPTRSRLKQLFKQGRILVNNEPARVSTKVRAGDSIVAEIPDPAVPELAPEPIPLVAVYEDEHIIVVDKPAGLLTHPTPSRTTGTLVNALLHHCKDLSGVGGWIKPGIVHRLDKLTSGVLVAAKSDAAHQGLADQFKEHSIDRRYLAIVYGELEKLTGTIETVIGRNPRHRLKMTGRTGRGRKAVTNYRIMSRGGGFSLVELNLETGRTHQIRVHLSEKNHPVVGDPLYGKGRTAPHKLSPEQRSALNHLKRQALHAFRLGFRHPVTDELMAFESPLPEDIRAVALTLGLLSGIELVEKPRRVE